MFRIPLPKTERPKYAPRPGLVGSFHEAPIFTTVSVKLYTTRTIDQFPNYHDEW